MPRVLRKYWLRFVSLGVALLAVIAAGAASGSCVFNTTTNFCEDFEIRCKAGQQCAADEAVCIDIGGCGDGIVDTDKGEMCDDGNIEDFKMENGLPVMVNGKPVLDSCSHDCKSTQQCGNHTKDSGEDCDDGSDKNGMSGSFCTIECKIVSDVCGNGIAEPTAGEQCDPGLMDSMDCNSFQADQVKLGTGCKASKCGDGYTNLAAMEQCDTGNKQDTRECNALICTNAICGDGYPNKAANEECDNGSDDTAQCNGNNKGTPNSANCHLARCGDGYINTVLAEVCDDGGDTTACNGNNKGVPNANNCHPASCGDGYVNGARGETCDNIGGSDTDGCNGNTANTDGHHALNAQCKAAACGDGYVNLSHLVFQGTLVKETCDTGGDTSGCNGNATVVQDFNGSHTNDGTRRCQAPSCGDGYINKAFKPGNAGPGQTGEECDNGPLNKDDQPNACRTNCRAPRCGDGVKDSGEQCEPNPIPGRPGDDNCPSNGTCGSDCKCKAGNPPDAGVDAAPDAGVDAGIDAGVSVDAGVDASVSVDAGP
jgi:hypothetical protein